MRGYVNSFEVNNRHQDILTFHHARARIDAFKYCGVVRFPKTFSELNATIRNNLIEEPFFKFKQSLKDHFTDF